MGQALVLMNHINSFNLHTNIDIILLAPRTQLGRGSLSPESVL